MNMNGGNVANIEGQLFFLEIAGNRKWINSAATSVTLARLATRLHD